MRPAAVERTARAPRPLREVLRYRNQRVINGFLRDYDVSEDEARALFQDVLRYLWLSAKSKHPLLVFKEQYLFDAMWHTFILHTRQYIEFCEKYFGRVLHHEPATKRPPTAQLTPREAARFEKERDRTIALVLDGLGEDVAVRWYDTHVKRYTNAFIEAKRIPLDARAASTNRH